MTPSALQALLDRVPELRATCGAPSGGNAWWKAELLACLDAIERLAKERGAARDEVDEERQRWQDASGLVSGGDPGGVTPEMLSRAMGKFYDLEAAARDLVGHEASMCVVTPPCGGCTACRFNAALDALPKEV